MDHIFDLISESFSKVPVQLEIEVQTSGGQINVTEVFLVEVLVPLVGHMPAYLAAEFV